jgi:protein translocase SecG subunit
MLQQIIIAIHLMVVTALVILVLYQKSEGGALGMGGSGVFTGRGQANALTRATGILATIFFLTSIALTVLPAWERHAQGGDDWTKAIDPSDIKVKEIKPGEKEPEAGKDSLFDQLQRAQQKRQQGAPGAAPVEQKPDLRPSQEPAQTEASKPEAAKPAEAPKAEPVIRAPTPEAPKVEAPAAETPKVDAPKAVEAPKPVEAAKPEAPKFEAPKFEAPKSQAPAANPAAPAEKPAAPLQWKSPTQ